MIISKDDVFNKLRLYLSGQITIEELVDWAETAMMESDFEKSNYELIRSIIAKLGLSDVRAFSLDWEECRDMINKLGYTVKLEFA